MQTVILQKEVLLEKVEQQIVQHSLQPLDVVVLRNATGAILDHYMIFLGYDEMNNEPMFIANYPSVYKNKTVQLVSWADMNHYGQKMNLSRVRTFNGNDYQRELALGRALSCLQKRSYSFIFNNCEHFANYVQCGNAYSQQTRNVSASLLALSLFATCTSDNPKVKAAGSLATGLSFITLMTELSGQQSF